MPPFVPNEYKVVGDITYIYLTHGKVAVQRYGRKLVAKFPQTPEGLARAIAKAEEFRQQLAGRAAK